MAKFRTVHSVEDMVAYKATLERKPVPGAARRQSKKVMPFRPAQTGFNLAQSQRWNERDRVNFPGSNHSPEGRRTDREEKAAQGMIFNEPCMDQIIK